VTVRHEKSRIYLICGLAGAGKTKYAREIAQEKQATHFSIDKYLNPPSLDLMAMHKNKLECEARILKFSEQLLTQGRDVVLDIAAFQRADRDRIRNWATSINIPLTLYYVTASPVTRRARVLKRNKEKGDGYFFDVSDGLFDSVERFFEPPSEDEGAILVNND
jgi:predicted kinase